MKWSPSVTARRRNKPTVNRAVKSTGKGFDQAIPVDLKDLKSQFVTSSFPRGPVVEELLLLVDLPEAS
jgi:hypothetical protein